MAYVAVRGGEQAVENSIELLTKYRTKGDKEIEVQGIENRLGLLIDRVMSEAGFYASEYAALALKQTEGSVDEAVFLLRAYRSTIARSYYSEPIDCVDMVIHRRISAAFKDVVGGQFLGATYDYTHRLFDFSILEEKEEDVAKIKQAWDRTNAEANAIQAPRVSEYLRKEGIIEGEIDHSEPLDITQQPITFPAPRSAVLQSLTRADTGFIGGLAYAGIRGFGSSSHPTVGELRTGEVAVIVKHPIVDREELYVGSFVATEVESFFLEESDDSVKEESEDPLKRMQAGQGDKEDTSTNQLRLGIGYGLVFGRNDNKAISMSVLDYTLGQEGDSILSNHEFVLLHGDCLEMSGFLSHLKLPHYVTFQSKLDRVRNTKENAYE